MEADQEPPIVVMVPRPCEWCSTGLYQRRRAEVQTPTRAGLARLCLTCAAAIGAGPAAPLVPIADELPLIGEDDAAFYVGGHTWTEAKTADYPHAYLLLTSSRDPVMHLRVVRFIRETGERRRWAPTSGPAAGRKMTCSYWQCGDFDYWTMPSQFDPILNRKVIDSATT
jgi:hypothetical protein